jgi:hypothetical protein
MSENNATKCKGEADQARIKLQLLGGTLSTFTSSVYITVPLNVGPHLILLSYQSFPYITTPLHSLALYQCTWMLNLGLLVNCFLTSSHPTSETNIGRARLTTCPAPHLKFTQAFESPGLDILLASSLTFKLTKSSFSSSNETGSGYLH